MSVFEIRVALTTEEFEQVVAFYRDGLGLDPGDLWRADGGHGQLLRAGRGTLEIFDPAYANHIDQIEVGQRVTGQLRLAFEVPDVEQALRHALAHGATLISAPILTPWGDLNARLRAPDGLQVTLYQTQSG